MDEVLAEELDRIPWFASVGRELSITLPFKVAPVSSWTEALEAFSEEGWEEALLGPQNRLTRFLSAHHRKRYRQWNIIAWEAKSRVVSPLVERVWQPFSQAHGLGEAFVSKVNWDVLAAVMEHEYRDCSGRPIYYTQLLDIYRQGHYPAGWKGEWPDGHLLIY